MTDTLSLDDIVGAAVEGEWELVGGSDGLRSELAEFLQRHGGRVDLDLLLAWARDRPDSELHSRIEWDDEAAAGQHRYRQMRQMLRSFRVKLVVAEPDSKEFEVPAFIRSSSKKTFVPTLRSSDDERKEEVRRSSAQMRGIGRRLSSLNLPEVGQKAEQLADEIELQLL